jgi:hypothetical protein
VALHTGLVQARAVRRRVMTPAVREQSGIV